MVADGRGGGGGGGQMQMFSADDDEDEATLLPCVHPQSQWPVSTVDDSVIRERASTSQVTTCY